MIRYFCAIFLVCSFNLFVFAEKPIEQIRTSEYDGISIDLKDFKKIIESINYYHLKAHKDTLDKYDRASLRIELTSKDQAISLSAFSQLKDLSLDDESYTNIRVSYSWDEKDISRVEISLNSAYRSLSITGSDVKKVEALFRDIDDQLSSNEMALSWIPFVFILQLLLMFAFIYSIKYFVLSFQKLYDGNRDRRTLFIFISTLVILIFEIIFFFSEVRIRDFFPDVQLTSNQESFIERYGEITGFFLSVITILGFLARFAFWGFEIEPKEEKKEQKKKKK